MPRHQTAAPVESPVEVMGVYFDAWRTRNFGELQSLLADDVTFDGPLAHVDNVGDFRDALERMARITTDIVVHKTFVDGPDVLTWFDLHTTVGPPAPTANWSRVEDGKITRVQVIFDARALAPRRGGD